MKPKAGQLGDLLERCEGIAAHEARKRMLVEMLVKMLKIYGEHMGNNMEHLYKWKSIYGNLKSVVKIESVDNYG